MPIDSTHADYAKYASTWQLMRDAITGEVAVKAAGPSYLPVPPGMPTMIGDLIESGKRVGSDPYSFYLSFAEFPEVVEPALAGFQGVVHARPPVCLLPSSFEYLREMACPDGSTLERLWSLVTEEVLSTGRLGLLIDVDASDSKLRLVPYAIESIRNWKERMRRDGGGAEFVVLRELYEEFDDDSFVTECVVRYRELRLNNGVYQARLWEETEGADDKTPKFVVVPQEGSDASGWVTIKVSGRTLDFIPFYPLNAVESGFSYGPIPMLPLARRAYAIYRKTADYNRALYVKGDPQICIAGISPEDAPQKIGGEGIWTFPDSQAKAYYLDIDGNGIPLMRVAIQDEYARFDMEGGKLLATDKTAPESGEALRQRQMAQQVTLRNIITNLGQQFENVLQQVVHISGGDGEDAEFSPDTDFAEPTMTSQELMELVTAKNSGAPMSYATMHELMRRGSLTQKSFEDEIAAIEEESARLAAIVKPEPVDPANPNKQNDKSNGKDASGGGTDAPDGEDSPDGGDTASE